MERKQTFREEAAVSIYQVFAQKPAISKLIVAFDQFHAIALGQTELVGAAGLEVIWRASKHVNIVQLGRFPVAERHAFRCVHTTNNRETAAGSRGGEHEENSRITRRMSPTSGFALGAAIAPHLNGSGSLRVGRLERSRRGEDKLLNRSLPGWPVGVFCFPYRGRGRITTGGGGAIANGKG